MSSTHSNYRYLAKQIILRLKDLFNEIGINAELIKQLEEALGNVESISELTATATRFLGMAGIGIGATVVLNTVLAVVNSYRNHQHQQAAQKAIDEMLQLQRTSLLYQQQQTRNTANLNKSLDYLIGLNEADMTMRYGGDMPLLAEQQAAHQAAVEEADTVLRAIPKISPEVLAVAARQTANEISKLVEYFMLKQAQESGIENSLAKMGHNSDLRFMIDKFTSAMKPMVFTGSVEGIEREHAFDDQSYGLAVLLYGDKFEALRRHIRDANLRPHINPLITLARRHHGCSVDLASELLKSCVIQLDGRLVPPTQFSRKANQLIANCQQAMQAAYQNEDYRTAVHQLLSASRPEAHITEEKVNNALKLLIMRAFLGEAYHTLKHLKGWRAAPYEVADGVWSMVSGLWGAVRHPINTFTALPSVPAALWTEARHHPLRLATQLAPSAALASASISSLSNATAAIAAAEAATAAEAVLASSAPVLAASAPVLSGPAMVAAVAADAGAIAISATPAAAVTGSVCAGGAMFMGEVAALAKANQLTSETTVRNTERLRFFGLSTEPRPATQQAEPPAAPSFS